MAAKKELEELGAALGKPAKELGALSALSAGQLQTLLQGFRDAQKRQRADMESAIQGALKHVPALLRGAIIRILR